MVRTCKAQLRLSRSEPPGRQLVGVVGVDSLNEDLQGPVEACKFHGEDLQVQLRLV